MVLSLRNTLFNLVKGDIFDGKNLPMWRCSINAFLHFDDLTYVIELEAPKELAKDALLRNERHMNNKNRIVIQQGIC